MVGVLVSVVLGPGVSVAYLFYVLVDLFNVYFPSLKALRKKGFVFFVHANSDT